MTKTPTETVFQAPYGNPEQHVYQRGQHHGYLWIVAHGVDQGYDAEHITRACQLAKDLSAPAHAVRRLTVGGWKVFTDYDQDEETVNRWRTYVLALEAYETALQERRTTFDITPKINVKYPLDLPAKAIGMWEVTATNWGEFFIRISLMEIKLGGAFLRDGRTGADVPITPEMARDHVGLMIQSANEERDAWMARIFGGKIQELEYAVETFDPSYAFPRPDEDDDEDGE
ncbi:hypothetical protein [Streptomyces sp. CBMA29]|uniref:hypothetical protein n=1 Tax=Streptomyces sp. CBMA29 TaxID=1896314 RepID=UPI001661DD4C|nr:hypothetical protein [Streptomyces sp. CBMA29]MBD0733986.1 hypothetical protein [Streptomyces sp. CBMA29]